MSSFKEEYPNIDTPEGLGAPKLVSSETSFVFPVSGPEPQQDDHYVNKKYYEDNIPQLLIPVQMPIGGIILWYGSITSIPENWALCDGSIVNDLQTPDLRSQFVVGAGSDAGENVTFNVSSGALSGQYAPGDTGGSVAHQLTIAEMPSHTHTEQYNTPSSGQDQAGSGSGDNDNTSSQNTGSTGGNQYHENRPPYYALAYIMKVS
tara:strand:- start:45 stop:659 length:615 start_codon:yes stop_codon:yes gene_type:complete